MTSENHGSSLQRMASRQLATLEWGLAPVVAYLQRALDPADLAAMTAEELGDVVFELYRALVPRSLR